MHRRVERAFTAQERGVSVWWMRALAMSRYGSPEETRRSCRELGGPLGFSAKPFTTPRDPMLNVNNSDFKQLLGCMQIRYTAL